MATMTPEQIQARKDKAAANKAAIERGDMPPKKKTVKLKAIKEDVCTLIIKDGDHVGTLKMPEWVIKAAIAELKVPTDKNMNIIITEEIKAAINDAGNSKVFVYGGGFLIKFSK